MSIMGVKHSKHWTTYSWLGEQFGGIMNFNNLLIPYIYSQKADLSWET